MSCQAKLAGRPASERLADLGFYGGYFDDTQWLCSDPRAETALITASNGKNDGGQVRPGTPGNAAAAHLQLEHGWGGCRTLVGPNFDLDVRLDQSLPAFTRCSLDSDLGAARELSPEESAADLKRQQELVKAGKLAEAVSSSFDGDAEGALNAFLRWRTDDVVDEQRR
jgi:hypothetical protein